VAGSRPAGFVNAVLRRVATRDLAAWLEIAAPSRQDDLIGHLSVRHSHPRWIVSALSEALGEDPAGGLAETEAALSADGERPLVTLCAVPGLADTAELADGGARPARWSPFGAYLEHTDPAQIVAVAQGRAAVQDEASQLAALALARAEPEGCSPQIPPLWLDLCAGPGGKTRLLAGLAEAAGARLLASDVRPHRARLVRAALASAGGSGTPGSGTPGSGSAGAAAGSRTPGSGTPGSGSAGAAAGSRQAGAVTSSSGGTGATHRVGVVVADGTVPAWRPGAFARVLADVPCSGLGALRRRPDGRWRRSPEDVAALGPLQRALLAAALDSAAPGGVVAYVTCSPHVAETRDVVADVVARRGDVRVLDAPAALPEVPGLRCPEPYGAFAQFWPHRHGTDAIFLALLRREG
jgi:16S rRNA (cytosine967-C5)-methyltransferase